MLFFNFHSMVFAQLPWQWSEIGKFCPLPEPIRLQDSEDTARSPTEKKKKNIMTGHNFLLLNEACTIHTHSKKKTRALILERNTMIKKREKYYYTTVLDEFCHGCGRFNWIRQWCKSKHVLIKLCMYAPYLKPIFRCCVKGWRNKSCEFGVLIIILSGFSVLSEFFPVFRLMEILAGFPFSERPRKPPSSL